MDFVVVPGLAGFFDVFDEVRMVSDTGVEFLEYRSDFVSFDEDDERGFRVAPGEVAEQLVEFLVAPFWSAPDSAFSYEQVVIVVAVEDVGLPSLVEGFSGD